MSAPRRGLPRVTGSVKDAAKRTKPVAKANAHWAKNTAIGTAKGVVIAASAATAAEMVGLSLRGVLKHPKRR